MEKTEFTLLRYVIKAAVSLIPAGSVVTDLIIDLLPSIAEDVYKNNSKITTPPLLRSSQGSKTTGAPSARLPRLASTRSPRLVAATPIAAGTVLDAALALG